MSETAEFLERVKNRINKSWKKGALFEGTNVVGNVNYYDGACCLVGAIAIERAKDEGLSSVDGLFAYDIARNAPIGDLKDCINKSDVYAVAMSESAYPRMETVDDIPFFNDTKYVDKEDVIAVIDCAIQKDLRKED